MKLYSVIKNERKNAELVWKYTEEDFNDNTQLIVMESEEALFVKNGVVLETFTGGKYTLNTDNYPFIKKLRTAVTGGENAFNCKVYFVDKTHQLEILWGTDSPIQIRDAEYGFAVGVRSRGSYSVEIENTKQFLIKLVGLNTEYFTVDDLKKQFRTVFQTKIKVAIASVMKELHYTVLDMNAELENIGEKVKEQLAVTLDEYGVRLVNFYIADISIPENDPNYKIINEAYAKAHAGKIEVDVQGEAWEKIARKEITKDIANNPNAGGMATAGAGLGMGMATMGMFGGMASEMMNSNNNQAQNNTTVADSNGVKCPECGAMVSAGSKFCSNCGHKLEEKAYFCKECGTKLAPDSKFCPNCGTRRDS